jgi:hypothetical protein
MTQRRSPHRDADTSDGGVATPALSPMLAAPLLFDRPRQR